ncbi:hypothetical protein V8F20_001340 [Naviculisporaceae sp. PSN 640]
MSSSQKSKIYRKDNDYIIAWIIDKSNSVIRNEKPVDEQGMPLVPHTAPTIRPAELIERCEIIADSLEKEKVPDLIFYLFERVIESRTDVNRQYEAEAQTEPCLSLKLSNRKHRYFIGILKRAFQILGGETWRQAQAKSKRLVQDPVSKTRLKHLETKLANSFAALEMTYGADASDTESLPQLQEGMNFSDKNTLFRFIREESAKISDEDVKDTAKLRENTRRIAEKMSQEGLNLSVEVKKSFVLAANISRQWSSARCVLQQRWKAFARGEDNSAAVAALCKVAVALVEDSAISLFVHCPDAGVDSFEGLIKVITFGLRTAKWGNRGEGLDQRLETFHRSFVDENSQEACSDLREWWMIPCYLDLTSFIDDFQKHRTGLPTIAMRKRLEDWDPTLDIASATADERAKWRSLFTITCLYELVNVLAADVIRRRAEGEKVVFTENYFEETGTQRPISGIPIANFIAHWAFQDPGSSYRQEIAPEHVFYLQCAIDSMTACYGWCPTVNPELRAVSSAQWTQGSGDIHRFLESFTPAVQKVSGLFEPAEAAESEAGQGEKQNTRPPPSHLYLYNLLQFAQSEREWLQRVDRPGATKLVGFGRGLQNGLWKYSPFLSGERLVPMIRDARRLTMDLWNTILEPTLILSIYSMLLCRGYITVRPASSGSLFPALLGTCSLAPEELIGPRGQNLTGFHANLKTPPFKAGQASPLMTILGKVWQLENLPQYKAQYQVCLRVAQQEDAGIGSNREHPVTTETRALLSGLIKRDIYADISGAVGPDEAVPVLGLNLPLVTLRFCKLADRLEKELLEIPSNELITRVYSKDRGHLSDSLFLKRADLLLELMSACRAQDDPKSWQKERKRLGKPERAVSAEDLHQVLSAIARAFYEDDRNHGSTYIQDGFYQGPKWEDMTYWTVSNELEA